MTRNIVRQGNVEITRGNNEYIAIHDGDEKQTIHVKPEALIDILNDEWNDSDYDVPRVSVETWK